MDIKNIILNSREDAERVIDKLIDTINDYGYATVADLNELIGLPKTVIANQYGWSHIGDYKIEMVLGGYQINLPSPKDLHLECLHKAKEKVNANYVTSLWRELHEKIGISDIGEMSDGYHTFNSLYYQRCILFATLINTFKELAWKSHKHSDGKECFDGGWFIVGIDTPKGSYTYHYEEKYWDMFECKELDKAPEWDGHTEKDVERLLSLSDKYEENVINLKKAVNSIYGLNPDMRWIPVEERLPEPPEYDWVLVKTRMMHGGYCGIPHVAEFRNGVWYCDSCEGPMEETLGLKVVAWFDMQTIK